ncbi:MAG: PhoPQ-activated pathogenicity-related family protein [Bacteroidales bacterium]|nr:PhoPQ-activated pathogenicity-related family protein [Bacteroidales bacterium]
MKHAILVIVAAILLTACSSPGTNTTPETSFPLKAYVKTEDKAFSYEIIATVQGESWTEYRVYMVSGTWLTQKEVDEPEWWHWLTMVVPDELRETESLMLIGGGWRGDTIPIAANEEMIKAALTTGSVVSHLSNIPFQPIDFKGDTAEGVYEDDLIAFAWMQFMEGGAGVELQRWLPRFPMTRAVVKAMDVVHEVCASNLQEVEKFFVAGASKRGWTTWDVAAVDERVIGIAPVVIDLLNVVPSFHHHWQCYGEWAPAIDPYTNAGAMNWLNSDEFLTLLQLVEPYQFLERLTMPKLLINAICDEFFVTDSWKFYWNDLEGENYLQYVPNVGHGLDGSYLPENLVSFYHTTITDAKIPEFKWHISNDTIYAEVEPGSDYQIRKWEAINEKDRDFKLYMIGEEAWQMEALEVREHGTYAIPITAPDSGYKGALVEIVFNPDSAFPLTLTTGTVVTPDRYPFDPFRPDFSAK